ncbi:sulfate adenylyltransferase subunit CysN [Endozoicomonas sp. SM1973]|uniref:Sulfate adenylyltransferase subunit 1 n=1 Tax=Spartinivicinus marinus TaxID=2994442 RepID=A0A853I2J5_9GAMM|nr:sulfate adenylyltransferase subunit CysN [Spartinivicinus marinus]MCX4025709.1 sulfate adenylyltransferase subunit CysN [Spartinivicinus marinus]NYZ65702.1 sulfate adenylyltransferase subunit CysN [Spartinivicinus marinus]
MSHQSDLIASDIHAYLAEHEQKNLLRFLTCGNVDDGKSTLIGRLLHDSKMIYEDQLAAVQADSSKIGTTGEKLDLALLVDGLQAEREQGITIDVAFRYFSTAKRKFIIADTPGHEQYTRNMATGASTCDLAIILVDARYGVQTQTRRHSYIAALLGIKHLIVAINKMDLIAYSEEKFNEIKKVYLDFAEQINVSDIRFVPISALDGDNVVESSVNMPWYQGETLMQILENVTVDNDKNFNDFRFPVQYVNRPNLNFRGFSGTVSSGVIKPGDDVAVLPSGKLSKIKSIVSYDGEQKEAVAGDAITLTLADEIDVSRGDMLVKAGDQPLVGHQFSAHVVWMSEAPLTEEKQYDIKLSCNSTVGRVESIQYKIDINTLEKCTTNELQLNEIAVCKLAVNKSIVFDPYDQNRLTGSFILIDRLTNVTVGAGMIINSEIGQVKDQPVTPFQRQQRFHQQPLVIMISEGNQSFSDTSQRIERLLFDAGKTVVILPDNWDQNTYQKVIPALLLSGLIVITKAIDSVESEAVVNIDEKNNSTEELALLLAPYV